MVLINYLNNIKDEDFSADVVSNTLDTVIDLLT